MNLTYKELVTLECVLMSAIYDCSGRIEELKSGLLTDNYKRDQLALWEKNKADYENLLRKIREEEKIHDKKETRCGDL